MHHLYTNITFSLLFYMPILHYNSQLFIYYIISYIYIIAQWFYHKVKNYKYNITVILCKITLLMSCIYGQNIRSNNSPGIFENSQT